MHGVLTSNVVSIHTCVQAHVFLLTVNEDYVCTHLRDTALVAQLNITSS